MNQSLLWLGIPMICYAAQAMNYYWNLKRVGMCLTFFGYCIANIGLIIDSYEVQ